MIKYRRPRKLPSFFKQLIQRSGSVFPSAFFIALPCSFLTAALTLWIQYGKIPFLQDENSVLKDNEAWGGFSFLVGFLIVFRTSQSYNRFWDGCTSTHRMRAEWFDGCSSLLAFCKHSKNDPSLTSQFQNTLVRLFSMLHAAALAEIEDCESEEVSDYEAFKFAIIDAEGIDETSLLVIKSCSHKVELIFQWIQQLIVENISTGVLSIPPPILSRSFQEIANGMVAFHDAMKISYIPFPFPYAQTCDFLLLLHWIVLPFVVCHWVSQPIWAAVFSFSQVFILWALNFIAVELENPFGSDANDIDDGHMQEEMNQHLVLLMSPSTKVTPTLSSKFKDLSDARMWHKRDDSKAYDSKDVMEVFCEKSFSEVWNGLAKASRNSLDSSSNSLATAPVARRSYGRLTLEQREDMWRKSGSANSWKGRSSGQWRHSGRILPVAGDSKEEMQQRIRSGENRSSVGSIAGSRLMAESLSHSSVPEEGILSETLDPGKPDPGRSTAVVPGQPSEFSPSGKNANTDLESQEIREKPALLKPQVSATAGASPRSPSSGADARLSNFQLEFEASTGLSDKRPAAVESSPETQVNTRPPGQATSPGGDSTGQIGILPSLEPLKVQASDGEQLGAQGCGAAPPGIIGKEALQPNGARGSDQASAEHSVAQCVQDVPCSSGSPPAALCKAAELLPPVQEPSAVQSQDKDVAQEARSLDTNGPTASTTEPVPVQPSEGNANSVVLDIS